MQGLYYRRFGRESAIAAHFVFRRDVEQQVLEQQVLGQQVVSNKS
jgi:hypothetical protein